MKKILNFWNGRSAMSFGLDILELKKNSIVLLPEIICDVAVKVFINKNLKVKFYKLNESFEPDWSEINRLNFKNISAILMVHFFGYPQKFDRFLKLVKKKNIYLIEDNCHSLPVKYKNKVLGTIGHIGIDSPRKIIEGLYSGGRLYINFKYKVSNDNIKKYEATNKDFLKRKIKQNFKNIYKYYKFKGKRPDFENPYLYSDQDNDFSLKLIDKVSLDRIKKVKLKAEYTKRKNQYTKIDNFVKFKKMKSLFNHEKNLIPMYYVAKTRSNKESIEIFNWGWKNKIQIVSWPSFYTKFNIRQKTLNRWKKYICFPLNQDFPDLDDKKI